MRQTDKSNHATRASSERVATSFRTVLIHKSLAKFVPPFLQSCLKWAYSSSQVGSGPLTVLTCSSGRPLGSTRLRTVSVLGPHLHRPCTWALPSSPMTSMLKVLRHETRLV